jgi:hypothetical protein
MKKIEGTLVYVRMNEPQKAYVKPGTPPKPNEWKASVVVTDKAVIKAYRQFAKELDTLVSVKEVEAGDFEAEFKCPLPEGAGDEVWVVTLRKSTELGKTGEPVPDKYKPRVYEQVQTDSGTIRNDITYTKEVGNGSKGALSIEVFTKTNGTGTLYLKNCLVTDLIEYERKSLENDGGEFDDEDDAPAAKSAPAKKAAPASKVAAKSKAKVQDDFADLEDDLPF